MTTDSPAATAAPPSALILGATGGIGRVLAEQLSAAGWRLFLAARRPEPLEALAAATGASWSVVEGTDSAAVQAVFDRAAEEFGGLSGAVNCCGSLLLKPAHLTTEDEWAATLAANLTTSFHLLRSACRVMMRNGGGSVVLLTSAVARRGMINHEAIAAAKAGVAGLALSGAATYARHGIRVNSVAPGLTRTPLTENLLRHEPSRAASVALHPLGRIGEAAEVASAIRWFLDPLQSWVTGQVLGVDGGLATVQSRAA